MKTQVLVIDDGERRVEEEVLCTEDLVARQVVDLVAPAVGRASGKPAEAAVMDAFGEAQDLDSALELAREDLDVYVESSLVPSMGLVVVDANDGMPVRYDLLPTMAAAAEHVRDCMREVADGAGEPEVAEGVEDLSDDQVAEAFAERWYGPTQGTVAIIELAPQADGSYQGEEAVL